MLKLNVYDRTTNTDGWPQPCCAAKDWDVCNGWLSVKMGIARFGIWTPHLHNLKWWSALNPEDTMLAGLIFGRICLVTYYLLNPRNRSFDKNLNWEHEQFHRFLLISSIFYETICLKMFFYHLLFCQTTVNSYFEIHLLS